MTEPRENTIHRYIRELLDAAESRGWMVVSAELRTPGYIVLETARTDVTVEIHSPYGLGVREVIEGLPIQPGPVR